MSSATDPKPSNFLRQIIEADLEKGSYTTRRFGGAPGDAQHHASGAPLAIKDWLLRHEGYAR